MKSLPNLTNIIISFFTAGLLIFVFALTSTSSIETQPSQNEWTSLFNGDDLSGWIVPEGDGGHWKVVDGVIDYDAMSEAEDDKALWSEKEYQDFVLKVDWRIKETPYINPNVPIIMPDGSHKLDQNGETIRMAVPDSDSGIYVRGTSKAQINIWNWPIGSGEVYGYRTDSSLSQEVRAGVTPTMNADHNIGEWNSFVITVEDEYLTVELNGHVVLDKAHLPGVPESGKIALQHHGSKDANGEWNSPPSLVQFKNISIKEL
ncbi:3-keto-disaccharide hydrolase [Rhodohalobacter sp. 614A]|uniref:3-keto-disaccharide hydrolase n=1 Tax=Rhodohalobacter sp. 614A TaxID=2908649 RepID=UPI001F3715FA|nr:DUF1080 domain-containing protein [Rhodohalobacter sp. 614A]